MKLQWQRGFLVRHEDHWFATGCLCHYRILYTMRQGYRIYISIDTEADPSDFDNHETYRLVRIEDNCYWRILHEAQLRCDTMEEAYQIISEELNNG